MATLTEDLQKMKAVKREEASQSLTNKDGQQRRGEDPRI